MNAGDIPDLWRFDGTIRETPGRKRDTWGRSEKPRLQVSNSPRRPFTYIFPDRDWRRFPTRMRICRERKTETSSGCVQRSSNTCRFKTSLPDARQNRGRVLLYPGSRWRRAREDVAPLGFTVRIRFMTEYGVYEHIARHVVPEGERVVRNRSNRGERKTNTRNPLRNENARFPSRPPHVFRRNGVLRPWTRSYFGITKKKRFPRARGIWRESPNFFYRSPRTCY